MDYDTEHLQEKVHSLEMRIQMDSALISKMMETVIKFNERIDKLNQTLHTVDENLENKFQKLHEQVQTFINTNT